MAKPAATRAKQPALPDLPDLRDLPDPRDLLDLPAWLAGWFEAKGWTPHRHQLEMMAAARDGRSALLIAPTGGGKTLGGFLTSLADLAETPARGLHTLYISPLKALAVDVHRNLLEPISGMLLTKRMERAGLDPLGFVATDYVIAVWSLQPPVDIDALLDQDMLGDDLESWMAESSLLKRTFRNVAVIAGLIERKLPGHEKTGRQVTFNADLIYDVLRQHQPDHILLRATRADAARGLTDIRRLGELLVRVQGKIDIRVLDRVSPLAVPVLLEIGRESVHGGALETLLNEAEDALIAEAMGGETQGALPI